MAHLRRLLVLGLVLPVLMSTGLTRPTQDHIQGRDMAKLDDELAYPTSMAAQSTTIYDGQKKQTARLSRRTYSGGDEEIGWRERARYERRQREEQVLEQQRIERELTRLERDLVQRLNRIQRRREELGRERAQYEGRHDPQSLARWAREEQLLQEEEARHQDEIAREMQDVLRGQRQVSREPMRFGNDHLTVEESSRYAACRGLVVGYLVFHFFSPVQLTDNLCNERN